MKPLFLSAQIREKFVPSLRYVPALALTILLMSGCGGTEAPAPTATIAQASSGSETDTPVPAITTEPTQGQSSSSSSESTPNSQASAPLIPADGTLRTAMQRVDEADGLKYTLVYTSAQGTPDLDYSFKIVGVASGKLLPNRKSGFTLTMTGGTKGAKQNGEWIMYWDFDQNKAFFKNGTTWQSVDTSELKSDPANFDPMYAYNQLGDVTTFGTTDLDGKANQDLLTQIAATFTLSGTEQLDGEVVDRYHLVGEAGGRVDIWVSKATGDIVKYQRDVTAGGMGTIAVLTLSDIGKPQSIETPK
jgi:hypothetical protein